MRDTTHRRSRPRARAARFEEHQPREPAFARAERRAHRELLAPRRQRASCRFATLAQAISSTRARGLEHEQPLSQVADE